MDVAYARKRHVRGATGFAVYGETLDGPYLGDVTPLHEVAPGQFHAKRPSDRDSRRRGWRAHPSSEAEPLPWVFVSRASAAAALLARWEKRT